MILDGVYLSEVKCGNNLLKTATCLTCIHKVDGGAGGGGGGGGTATCLTCIHKVGGGAGGGGG